MILLGAHVSTSGGVFNAPQSGEALGCTAIQIFTKNQRQWSAPPLPDPDITAYFEALAKTNIRSVVSHDSYLINMASPDPAMRSKSTAAFIDEIKRAHLLKLNGLVFHPGSHMGAGEAEGIQNQVQSLVEAVEKTPGCRVPLLIEATAGQGTNLGHRFEHLRDLLEGLEKAGIGFAGVCLDTCHLFGAGYDIRNKKAYAHTLKTFNAVVGLKYVKCIHFNDSINPLGSRKDRHDNIGKGLLGREAFRLFLADKRFKDVPKILETPGGDEFYKKDLKLLRGLLRKK
jgi:deoxyribonuclease-4